MKTFLQHDESGFFYKENGWVQDVAQARAFSTIEDAERFREKEHVAAAHTVSRMDPSLIARFLARPPGRYQAGE